MQPSPSDDHSPISKSHGFTIMTLRRMVTCGPIILPKAFATAHRRKDNARLGGQGKTRARDTVHASRLRYSCAVYGYGTLVSNLWNIPDAIVHLFVVSSVALSWFIVSLRVSGREVSAGGWLKNTLAGFYGRGRGRRYVRSGIGGSQSGFDTINDQRALLDDVLKRLDHVRIGARAALEIQGCGIAINEGSVSVAISDRHWPQARAF